MYLVDANVLIEAKNRYYAFDIAPGFWAWLERANDSQLACSIEAVRDELLDGADELANWARTHADFFRPIDEATTQHFAPLTAWAASREFTPAALAAFTGDDADYLLIAYARQHGHVVVTHEVAEPNSKTRVKIPDACIAMGVSCSTTFETLRNSEAVLDLRE